MSQMPKWLKKSLVVLVTICTFGLVTPPQVLMVNEHDINKAHKRNSFESKPIIEEESLVESDHFSKQHFVEVMTKEAEEKAYLKFGEKIKPVIKDEFQEVILPNMVIAISEVAASFPEENLRNLSVTEQPTGGQGEKIFHIFDTKSKEDMIRFHVRRDHPPQQGYWFNFHYHTYHDRFQTHHDLGSIYWDKNIPPKWMS